MRAFEVRGSFGLESVVPTERPDPSPGPGQVVVAVRAASLNYRDLMMVKGVYNPKQPLPLIPLSDGVGEVVAVGPGASRAKVGDRVAGLFAQGWLAGEPSRETLRTTLGGPLDGMLAEKVVLGDQGVVHVPEHLTDEEAATLPCAAVTAWSALVTEGGLKAGDTVLVQGTGGVSLFALQFARMAGARVIITSSRDEKLERARQLGASDGINYKTTPDWDRRARELTGGAGVDHVVEVGGAGTLERSLAAVRMAGRVSLIGVLSGRTSDLDIAPILMRKVRVQGVFVGHRETFEAMNRAIALHRLRPVVDRVFPFEEARAAFEHMESGAHFGKVVIRIRP
jgi:NADPH:quinone reductase-like Zn-dependent oxidoreductase